MSFNFKTQLRAGKLGEMLFLQANPDLKPNTDYNGDFVDVSGRKVELKTDFYAMEDTPNFFLERYSNKVQKTPGGPWQSLEHGTDTFIYMHVPNLTYFVFSTGQLVERLETIIPTLPAHDVKNSSHTSVGYRVPRTLLTDICTQTILEVRKRTC
jgi:hypothetical protein